MDEGVCDLQSSVADWLIEYPMLHRLFEQLQLEASCGGRSLEYECRRLGHDPVQILRLIARQRNASSDSTPR